MILLAHRPGGLRREGICQLLLVRQDIRQTGEDRLRREGQRVRALLHFVCLHRRSNIDTYRSTARETARIAIYMKCIDRIRVDSRAANTRGTYLKKLRMRVSLHPGSTRAQDIRDRLATFRFVQLLHGSFVEQEDRDLLQASTYACIPHLNRRRRMLASSSEFKRENLSQPKCISDSRLNLALAYLNPSRIDFPNPINSKSNPRLHRLAFYFYVIISMSGIIRTAPLEK